MILGRYDLPRNQRQHVYANGTLVIDEINKATDVGKYRCEAQGSQADPVHRDVQVTIISKFTNRRKSK